MPDPSTPPDVEKRRSKPPNTLGWEERAGWPLVSVSLFDLLCADLDVGAPLLVALPPSLACLADVSVVCCCCCCGCGCGCGCCCCELLLPNLEATDCSHDPRRDPAPGPAGALLGAPFLPKVIRLVDIGGGGGASSAGAWAVLVVGWLGVDDVGATAIGESSAGGPDVDDMVFVMAFCLLCLSLGAPCVIHETSIPATSMLGNRDGIRLFVSWNWLAKVDCEEMLVGKVCFVVGLVRSLLRDPAMREASSTQWTIYSWSFRGQVRVT
jgi:hypothetical protein